MRVAASGPKRSRSPSTTGAPAMRLQPIVVETLPSAPNTSSVFAASNDAAPAIDSTRQVPASRLVASPPALDAHATRSSAGTIDARTRRYSPRYTGLRFSANARGPSRASFEAKTGPPISSSFASASFSE